ncbi:MAG: sigma-70 family RNA polymerase sigma factor, partial [Actinobacteria bacterium]|nr:sigma-70 family RNA polymerase sigma factor [Actinomycetota bacterium]
VTPAEPDDEVRGVPALLAALPDRERAAMVLRHVDDMTVAQIAEAMGITVQAAESLLARATRRLRNQEARDA